MSDLQVELSQIDQERFGFRIARVPTITPDTLSRTLDACRSLAVDMLMVRVPTTEIRSVQGLEQAGFLLMDTLIYYRRSTLNSLPATAEHITIRPVQPTDVDTVRQIAAASFKGYVGHYHADTRLDPVQCDEVYISWALRSCESRQVAQEVLVAEDEGAVVGFLTLRMNSAEEGEGPLFAVLPSARHRGSAAALMTAGIQWCAAQGCNSMIISTQIVNLASQKVWSRLGFEPSHSYYTFHKWFI